ncbi:hypothetical protein L1887_21145 [Cichorium endivia]|nr:hypothetical protein L1887_21145 [Cichorium endivia]
MAEQDEGVPANVNRDEIKRFFDRFGRVLDVYAAGRKDSSGKFFALKRFKEVLHTEILEKKMQGLMYRGNLLKVNLAKFERRMNESDTRRAAGRDSRIRDQWIDNSKNRQVQWANRKRHGRSFVVVVRENEEVEHITKTSIPLKGNMEMGKWLKRFTNSFDDIINMRDLSMGKLGVVTSRRQWINEELIVSSDGKNYRIGIVEYTDDWSPFKECPFDKTENFDNEEEKEDEEDDNDGISDTWMDEEAEEGEFIPEVPTRLWSPAIS